MIYRNIHGSKTDNGKQRVRNEDAFATLSNQAGQLFVVCDGMGGHPGGDLAAKIASTGIKSFFTDHADKILSLQREAIDLSLKHANELIKEAVAKHPSYTSMGTTCEVVFLHENKAFWGHIGDSRIYHLSEGKLSQLTKDHSYVQHLLETGTITQEEAKNHPRKNEISQCLGAELIYPQIGAEALELQHGDMLLICTDGLTNMVDQESIRQVLVDGKLSTQGKADKLVKMANDQGGADNITVILVQHIALSSTQKEAPEEAETVVPQAESTAMDFEEKQKKDRKLTFAAFSAFFLLLMFLYLQKHGFMGMQALESQQKSDSLMLVNARYQRQLEIFSEQETNRFAKVRDNYFDAYDNQHFRIYGLFRDKARKFSENDVSVMFNIFNPNAIDSKEVMGERWFIVPVKGLHYLQPGESITEITNYYYQNPADSQLIKKFNFKVEAGRHLFIPFSQ